MRATIVRRVLALVISIPTLVVIVLDTGCSNLVVHTFEGQHYDATNDCLDPKGVVDVLQGVAHGTCSGVRCFVEEKNGVEGDAFVSTSCQGDTNFRDGTMDPAGTTCANALAAYARGAGGACSSDV